jgi:hypothetical protein
VAWLEFYFLFIKFPLKFKRTGSAYILVSFFLVEVVRFFVTYGLARNKNRLCKGWDNRIVQKHTQINKNTKITD